MNRIVRHLAAIAAGGVLGITIAGTVGYLLLMFGGDNVLHYF